MTMERLTVKSDRHLELIDLTDSIGRIVEKSGVEAGVCFLYVPHTTAAVTVNENADPDVRRDIVATLQRIVPREWDYTHFEGNSAAHILSTLVGVSLCVPISGGTLKLGRWQGIFFCEFDGPRTRNIDVSVITGEEKTRRP